jgi:hypothetical protein
MNERIRELAGQAGMYDFVLEAMGIGEEFEKLAKLIIQECIGIVEGIPPGYKDYRDQIEDAFRRDCVEEIKQSFGVSGAT